MNYNFSIVDYQKSEDENKAIQKLAEHRDIKLMVKEIGEEYGIDIQSTEGNSHLGDFIEDKEALSPDEYSGYVFKKLAQIINISR